MSSPVHLHRRISNIGLQTVQIRKSNALCHLRIVHQYIKRSEVSNDAFYCLRSRPLVCLINPERCRFATVCIDVLADFPRSLQTVEVPNRNCTPLSPSNLQICRPSPPLPPVPRIVGFGPEGTEYCAECGWLVGQVHHSEIADHLIDGRV